jgi:cyclohexanone monooxygenase/pentalenolactone D synthase
VLGGEFVGAAIARLRQQGVEVFDVSDDAEEAWTQKIVDSFVDGSAVMSACTPSRINNEGHPEALNPRNGNYGRGFGDFFAYRQLLEEWLADGRFEGLELEVRSTAP